MTGLVGAFTGIALVFVFVGNSVFLLVSWSLGLDKQRMWYGYMFRHCLAAFVVGLNPLWDTKARSMLQALEQLSADLGRCCKAMCLRSAPVGKWCSCVIMPPWQMWCLTLH